MRTKEDNELLHQRNQPLAERNYRFKDDPGVSMRARVSRMRACMCSKIHPCDDRPPKKKLSLLRWSCCTCVTRVCIYVSGKIPARASRASSANSIVPYGTRSSFTRESRSDDLWWRNHRSRYVKSLHRMYAVNTEFNELTVYSEIMMINGRRHPAGAGMWTFECLTRFHVRFAASRILMTVYRSAV